MAGIQEVTVISELEKERVEELARIARGEEDGVAIDSVDFHFTKYAGESCCCNYSIWGNSLRVEWYNMPTTGDDDALQILHMLVASAALECLSFRFNHLNPDDSRRLMRALCPVVCTSRRLATLSFSFEVNSSNFEQRGSWLLGAELGVRHFLETGFAVLLRDNPVFSQLTVAVEGPSIESLRDENRSRPDVDPECCSCRRLGMAYTFSRNPALKDSKAAWTLGVSCTCEPYMHLEMGSMQEMFMLFPVDNALLKEVVVTRECHGLENPCGRSREDIADPVARNGQNAVPRAVRCNRSPKEFEYTCTLVEVEKFVRVFVPYWGRDSNSSLATLAVHITGNPPVSSCMSALAPLHGATVAALKAVVFYGAKSFLGRSKGTLTLMGSDDSQSPHPNVGCVTLSRLRVYDPYCQSLLPRDVVAPSWESLSYLHKVLEESTTLKQVEIAGQFCRLLLPLSRTSFSSDHLRPVSALKLHFGPYDLFLQYPERLSKLKSWSSESVVARSWMTLVKRLVATLDHVEAKREPGRLAPSECESPTMERVEAVHRTGPLSPSEYERGVQGKVRKGLKRLVKKELRRNTWLQYLQVGWWRLVRVGAHHDEWEMRYDGPCLRRPEEYHVEVELQ